MAWIRLLQLSDAAPTTIPSHCTGACTYLHIIRVHACTGRVLVRYIQCFSFTAVLSTLTWISCLPDSTTAYGTVRYRDLTAPFTTGITLTFQGINGGWAWVSIQYSVSD